MTSSRSEPLPDTFHGHPPASQEAIAAFEQLTGMKLPHDYAAFLCQANGGVGIIGSTYIELYRLEELVEMNRAYEIGLYAPGLFLFGSDGGGEGLALDLREPNLAVVQIPFIGMALDTAETLAPSFGAFLDSLRSA